MTESDDELAELQGRLGQLRTEHRDLDDVMARLVEKAPFDQLQLQRLKKRKLGLKDMMARIEDANAAMNATDRDLRHAATVGPENTGGAGS